MPRIWCLTLFGWKAGSHRRALSLLPILGWLIDRRESASPGKDAPVLLSPSKRCQQMNSVAENEAANASGNSRLQRHMRTLAVMFRYSEVVG